MWSKYTLLGAGVLGLLAAGCSDRMPTTATPSALASRADVDWSNGARSLVADFAPDVPIAYYDLSLQFTKQTGGFTPPVQGRAYGYMGLALYESLVSGMPENRSVASQLHGVGALPAANGIPYNWALVANAALAEVMRGLWGDKTDHAAVNIAALNDLEASFAAQYSEGVPPGLSKLSIEFGHAVGAAVFATSMDDGGNQGYLTNFPASYVPPIGPGFWAPTAPGQVAMQPFWGTTVTSFTLSKPDECDPGAPLAYSDDPASAFYADAQQDYQISHHLNSDQLTVAHYWADGAGTFSGPGHSMAIIRALLQQRNGTLADAAEAYGRAGLAEADAMTAVWWEKYRYNLIRPITYIRRVIDPAWTTVLPTPPFPEYVSAHSGQSAAVMTTLETYFGTNVSFVDHAHDADGFAPRIFSRIYAAAEEAGISRVYAGIHFPTGNVQGQALGRCVAAKVDALAWRQGALDSRATAGQ